MKNVPQPVGHVTDVIYGCCITCNAKHLVQAAPDPKTEMFVVSLAIFFAQSIEAKC